MVCSLCLTRESFKPVTKTPPFPPLARNAIDVAGGLNSDVSSERPPTMLCIKLTYESTPPVRSESRLVGFNEHFALRLAIDSSRAPQGAPLVAQRMFLSVD
jgi:hypothetical protein